MKYLVIAVGVVLAGRGAVFGQAVGEAATPFKGTNVILLHTPDSAGVALNKLARALIINGIEPDKIDSQVGYLTTKAKPVGQLSPAIFRYRAVASREPGGTLLTITGTYTVQLNAAKSMADNMYWTKGNLLQAKQCFITVQPAAEAYPGGRVGYMQKAKP